MLDKVIQVVITTLVGSILGFFGTRMKKYAEKEKQHREDIETLKSAMLSQIKSTLTNTFYAYDEIAEEKGVPDFVQQNWIEEYDNYKKLGGNHYMENLYDKVKDWKTRKTI